MSKATDKRAQLAIERTRAKLKQRELEIVAAERRLKHEREELRRERGNTVALLQVLTEQYGNPKWDADTPIPDVIERFLMDPIMAQVSRLLRTPPSQRTPAATAPPAPSPSVGPSPAPRRAPPSQQQQPTLLRPSPVPEVPHKSMVVRGQNPSTGFMGWVPRCMRGCKFYEVWPSEREALQAAQDHDARLNDTARPGQGRALATR